MYSVVFVNLKLQTLESVSTPNYRAALKAGFALTRAGFRVRIFRNGKL